MNMDILSGIRKELQDLADETIKQGQEHYFKEEIHVYGVKNPVVARVAIARYKDVKNLGKKAVFELCEELFKSGYMEEAFVACEWAYRSRKEYVPEDFITFERWVGNYVSNWAVCDTLCNHTVGAFMEKFPQYLKELKRWTASENRWFRRAAAVTLVLPARNGLFLTDILEIADSLLPDKDDLVQKGYGWMLKEASKPHLAEVFDYVMLHRQNMPRTALRYAIEKMPEDLKRQAMAR